VPVTAHVLKPVVVDTGIRPPLQRKGWAVVVPTIAWTGGFAAALLIGAIAGSLAAIRAARLAPTEAPRTV
jgi:ABC-type antimicrobial peptide transport system permease subunit